MTAKPSLDAVTTLSEREAATVAHAINADAAGGKPYADPRNVRHFTADYAAKCIRDVLASTTITNMSSTERDDLTAVLARIGGAR